MARTNFFTDFPIIQKAGAEFIGTYIMLFSAAAAPILNQKYDAADSGIIISAISAGLAVMGVVLSIGHVSGAHLNPSVTIAFAALRHFPWIHVPFYIGAQISGSISAAFSLKAVFHPFMSGGVTVPSIGSGQAFAIEFIVTFILMFVIISVATDTRAVGELAGIAIGGIIVSNILVAGRATGGSMNPARTIGPAIAAENYRGLWIYITAPTFGALAGAATYTAVKLRRDTDTASGPSKSKKSGSFGGRRNSLEKAKVTSNSNPNSTAWKVGEDSWLCLPGDCVNDHCSEFENFTVTLCYKEPNEVADFLARKPLLDEGQGDNFLP